MENSFCKKSVNSLTSISLGASAQHTFVGLKYLKVSCKATFVTHYKSKSESPVEIRKQKTEESLVYACLQGQVTKFEVVCRNLKRKGKKSTSKFVIIVDLYFPL